MSSKLTKKIDVALSEDYGLTPRTPQQKASILKGIQKDHDEVMKQLKAIFKAPFKAVIANHAPDGRGNPKGPYISMQVNKRFDDKVKSKLAQHGFKLRSTPSLVDKMTMAYVIDVHKSIGESRNESRRAMAQRASDLLDKHGIEYESVGVYGPKLQIRVMDKPTADKAARLMTKGGTFKGEIKRVSDAFVLLLTTD
jgi:uncharacterized DUF497 family protein